MKRKKSIILGALAVISATSFVASCGEKNDPSTEQPSQSESKSSSSASESSSESKSSSSTTESTSEVTYTSIYVEEGSYQDTFGIGDKVSYKGIKIYANKSDGKTENITPLAEIDTKQVDTSKAGTYTVTVTWDDFSTSYTVTVLNNVFDRIEVVEGYQYDYTLYATPDFTKIELNAVYKNAVTGEEVRVEINNAAATFEMKDSSGNVVTSLNAIGKYTVTVTCNESTTTFEVECVTQKNVGTVKEAVESAYKNDSTIKGGSYVRTNSSYETNESYTLCENYVKVSLKAPEWDSDYDTYNYYYSLDQNSDIYAICIKAKDGVEDESTAEFIEYDYDGVEVNTSNAKAVYFDILQDGNEDLKFYGFGNVINGFYELYKNSVDPAKSAQKGTLSNIKGADDAAVEGYSFTFNYVAGSTYASFKTINVEFVLNDSGAVGEACITVTSYVSEENPYIEISELATIENLPSDLGLELVKGNDEAGAALYSFKVLERTEETTYVKGSVDTHKVSQELGIKEDDEDLPYLFENQTVTDFKTYVKKENGDEEISNGSTFNIDLDNADVKVAEGGHRFEYKIKVSSFAPETVLEGLADVSVVIKGTAYDGTIVDSESWAGYSYAYVRSKDDDGYYTIQIARAGTYTVTVKAQTITKSFTYNVQFEAPDSIGSRVYDGESGDFAEVSEFSCYTTNEIYLDAVIAKYFEQGYTAKVQVKSTDDSYVDVDSSKVSLIKGKYTVNGKEVECYRFNATEAGTYKITLVGATPDNASKTAATTDVIVTVSEAPSINDILKGDYNYAHEAVVSDSEAYKVVFSAPSSEGTGSVVISDKYDASKQQVATYKYENSKLVLTTTSNTLFTDGTEFTVEISAYYKLAIKNATTEVRYVLSKPTSAISPSAWALLEGKYKVVDKNTVFNFVKGEEKGTGSVDITSGSSTAKYTYIYNDETGELTLTLSSGDDLGYGSSLQLFVSNENITLKDGDTDYTLEKITVDYASICQGTYSLIIRNGGNEDTYSIAFGDSNEVTLTKEDKYSPRTGVYSYQYDEISGQLKLTKKNGNAVTIQSGLFIKDDTLVFSDYVMDEDNQMTKVTIPCNVNVASAYIGTWYGIDEFDKSLITVSISSTQIKVTGDTANGTFYIVSVNENVVTYQGTGTTIVLTLSDDAIDLNYSNFYVTSTLSRTNPKVIKVDSDLIGKYTGAEYSVTLEESSLTYGDYSYSLESYKDGVYTFKDGDYAVKLVVSSDGTITFVDEYEDEYIVTKGGSTTITFSEDYVGTYHDSTSEYALIVTTNSVTFQGIVATNILEDYDGGYTFDITEDETTTNYTFWVEDGTATVLPTDKVADRSQWIELTKDAAASTITELLTSNTYAKEDDESSTMNIEDGKVVTYFDYSEVDLTYVIDSTQTTATYIYAKDGYSMGYYIKLTLNSDGTITCVDDQGNSTTYSRS